MVDFLLVIIELGHAYKANAVSFHHHHHQQQRISSRRKSCKTSGPLCVTCYTSVNATVAGSFGIAFAFSRLSFFTARPLARQCHLFIFCKPDTILSQYERMLYAHCIPKVGADLHNDRVHCPIYRTYV